MAGEIAHKQYLGNTWAIPPFAPPSQKVPGFVLATQLGRTWAALGPHLRRTWNAAKVPGFVLATHLGRSDAAEDALGTQPHKYRKCYHALAVLFLSTTVTLVKIVFSLV